MLSVEVVKESVINYIGYVKLGGYAIKEGKKEKKEIAKASLISEGSLQVEGFFNMLFLYLLFCKTGSRISAHHQPLLILWEWFPNIFLKLKAILISVFRRSGK